MQSKEQIGSFPHHSPRALELYASLKEENLLDNSTLNRRSTANRNCFGKTFGGRSQVP